MATASHSHVSGSHAKSQRAIPGPFAQALIERLEQESSFDGFKIRVKNIELGQDPRNQEVSAIFRVEFMGPTPAKEHKGRHLKSAGPVLSFTFSPHNSVTENLAEFEAFVREHAAHAWSAPLDEDSRTSS